MAKMLKKLFVFTLLVWVSPLSAQFNLVTDFTEPTPDLLKGYGIKSVAAGDFNGDSYDDYIVGEIYYNNDQGRVSIYFGSSDPDTLADVTLYGDEAHPCFGFHVENIGDINNDGYDDIGINAIKKFSGIQGMAYIFLGGASIGPNPDLVIPNHTNTTYRPLNIRAAGDVNNDGYDDFIIVKQDIDKTQGDVELYYGGNPVNISSYTTFSSGATSDGFGYAVAGVGDVNNDNYDDLIITKTFYTGDKYAYLYYGSENMDTTPDITISSSVYTFGQKVAGVGDINGDGYDDFVISALSNNGWETGIVYGYYGADTGSMDAVSDFSLTHTTSNYCQFGYTVAGLGDLNNDNYDDFAVYATGIDYHGETSIYFGGSTFDTSYDLFLEGSYFGNSLGVGFAPGGADLNGDGYDDLVMVSGLNTWDYIYNDQPYPDGIDEKVNILYGGASMDATIDLVKHEGFEYATANNNTGISVACAGDVNNDGYNDIIIGASYYENYKGRAYIYYGGDNPDNVADVILTGEAFNNYFGCCVDSAGDVNNDGYDDILVGANDAGNDQEGKAYLFLGGENMDNTADLVLTGTNPQGEFGRSLCGVGDVNDDGFDDFAIASPYIDGHEGVGRPGHAYVYFGSDPLDGTADITMTGSDDHDCFGHSVGGGGDFNNDGYPDVLIGAPKGGNDFEGEVYLLYGGPSMDNIPDVTFYDQYTDYNTGIGGKMSIVGDLNNDGFDDVLLKETYFDEVNEPELTYLYYGNNTGDNTPDLVFGSSETINKLNTFTCPGDLDGDGIDDLLTGNKARGTGGLVRLYYGGSGFDKEEDFSLEGQASNDYFGSSIAGVGDWNNDGELDFIVGAPGQGNDGRAYLYNSYSEKAYVRLNILLQGAYDGSMGDPMMTSAINSSIPTTSPYEDARTVNSIPAYITDWVWVELRETIDGPAIAGRSFFLDIAGNLVNDDGLDYYLNFWGVPEGDYYIVIKHRNHLSVITPTPKSLGKTLTMHNFVYSTDNYPEGDAAVLDAGEGYYGMYAGDSDDNGLVTNADKDVINANMDATGYQNGDLNMDGIVTNADKDLVNSNMDKSTHVSE